MGHDDHIEGLGLRREAQHIPDPRPQGQPAGHRLAIQALHRHRRQVPGLRLQPQFRQPQGVGAQTAGQIQGPAPGRQQVFVAHQDPGRIARHREFAVTGIPFFYQVVGLSHRLQPFPGTISVTSPPVTGAFGDAHGVHGGQGLPPVERHAWVRPYGRFGVYRRTDHIYQNIIKLCDFIAPGYERIESLYGRFHGRFPSIPDTTNSTGCTTRTPSPAPAMPARRWRAQPTLVVASQSTGRRRRASRRGARRVRA